MSAPKKRGRKPLAADGAPPVRELPDSGPKRES